MPNMNPVGADVTGGSGLVSLYCTTDALALASFALRTGNGMLRMDGMAYSHMLSFLLQKGRQRGLTKPLLLCRFLSFFLCPVK